jgi:ubiquitin C-terminal hydrolase
MQKIILHEEYDFGTLL